MLERADVVAHRYWYFGDRTSAIITRDLSLRAPFAGRSFVLKGLTVVHVVDVFVAVNAYTTYPLLVVVLQARPASVHPCHDSATVAKDLAVHE